MPWGSAVTPSKMHPWLEANVAYLDLDEPPELTPPSAWRGQGYNCQHWNNLGASTAVPAKTNMHLVCVFRTHKEYINVFACN